MSVKLLSVGDPAVFAYVDSDLGLLERCRSLTGLQLDFDILPWDQYGERVFAVASGEASGYDVIMIPGQLWLPRFAENNWLRPLSASGPLNRPEYNSSDILPAVADEMRYRDVPYLVPSFSDGHILYSHQGLSRLTDGESGRADVLLFADAAFRSRGAAVGSPSPMILKKAPSEIFLDWLPYLRSFGGEFLLDDGTPGFAGVEGRRAAAYYRELARESNPAIAPYGNEEVAQAIREHSVEFAVSWGGQAGLIVDDRSRPTLSYATLTHPWNVTWSFGILKNSTDPLAAEEVLAVLSDSHSDRVIGQYAGSPSRASSYADPRLRETCPWFSAQEDLIRTAKPLPSRPDLAALLGPISAALTDIVDNDMPIEARLAEAAREISAK